MAAYGLPKDTAEAKAARSAAISDAMAGAARPPADLMAASVRLVGPGRGTAPRRQQERDLRHRRRRGRDQRRRATAAVNIEANLPSIKDPALAAELTATAALAAGVTDRAGRVIAAIREEIAQ